MEKRKEILTEISAISPLLAGINRSNPYFLPENYFDILSQQVTARLETVQLPATTAPGFAVPEGYFENLAGNILQKIQSQNSIQQELEEIAPLLNTIAKTDNLYSIPEGYFESLAADVTTTKQPAKIVQMPVRKRSSWFTYATAATVTGIIAFSGYFAFNNKPVTPSTTTSDQTEATSSIDLQSVPDSELDNYLREQPNNLEVAATAAQDDADFTAVLRIMSEDEIKEYLKENIEPGEKNTTEI